MFSQTKRRKERGRLWGIFSYTCSFIRHVKSVQNIHITFEYVKIARHYMCNLRFLTICLVLCVFLFAKTILWTHYDLSSSVKHFSTMMTFDLSLFVEHICNRLLSTRNSFNSISSAEQMCEIGICFVAVIYVLTG